MAGIFDDMIRELPDPDDLASTADGLSPAEHRVVKKAREAMVNTITQRSGPQSNRLVLAVVTVSGSFADLCSRMQLSDDLVAAVNAQLRGAGLELVRLARN